MPSTDAAKPDDADAKSNLTAAKERDVPPPVASLAAEVDEFGLPVRKPSPVSIGADSEDVSTEEEKVQDARKEANGHIEKDDKSVPSNSPQNKPKLAAEDSESEDEFADARPTLESPSDASPIQDKQDKTSAPPIKPTKQDEVKPEATPPTQQVEPSPPHEPSENKDEARELPAVANAAVPDIKKPVPEAAVAQTQIGHTRGKSSTGQGISEWSHQHIAVQEEPDPAPQEDEWQVMPAYASYDMYDDDNKLIAREAHESGDEADAYAGLGGAGRGYTRVQLDEDAQSATSLDENTKYLFKESWTTGAGEIQDEEARDAVSQMQATKDLLTEGQRIAYVGMTRLIISIMLDEATVMAAVKGSKKEVRLAAESMHMWSQKMMVRLYAHMDISSAEQIMIEQLVQHGVRPSDLTPTLMQNARVKNPMAEEARSSVDSSRPGSVASSRQDSRVSSSTPRPAPVQEVNEEEAAAAPPPYREHEGVDLPEVRTPSQLPTTSSIDIDLRWTVLCDLFLVLVADSVYDARSRVLLERVGDNMKVPWVEICRFEKRVTDALEMQQSAEKENWNEDVHKENRRKMALKKRYMMMGLATVGGGLVIGLSWSPGTCYWSWSCCGIHYHRCRRYEWFLSRRWRRCYHYIECCCFWRHYSCSGSQSENWSR